MSLLRQEQNIASIFINSVELKGEWSALVVDVRVNSSQAGDGVGSVRVHGDGDGPVCTPGVIGVGVTGTKFKPVVAGVCGGLCGNAAVGIAGGVIGVCAGICGRTSCVWGDCGCVPS